MSGSPQPERSPSVMLPRPPDTREFTLRAVLVALVVAVIIGASYPYIVLKLGFGPNIAVVSAFFGYLILAIFARGAALRFESNLAQSAGTIAGQTAFMCTILAAFDLLSADKALGLEISLSSWQIFLWLVTAGTLGVFLGIPMRRHYIVDERLPFPDGIAAAETLNVLDARGADATTAVRAMLGGLAGSMLLSLATMRKAIADAVPVHLNRFSEATGLGFAVSLLAVGTGIIIGLRICANMLVGLVLAWVIAPVLLVNAGIIAETPSKTDVLLWVMWPATGMLIAGGVASLFLKWNVLKRSFQGLSDAGTDSDEFPMRGVVAGILVSSIAVVVVQYYSLGLPLWQSALALLLSLPLMLVGLRVLGETNWGPISALSNVMQGVFGAIAPGNVPANMVASGLTGTIVANSEGIIQSYKTGHMIGSKPKYLTYVQLMAVPVAAVVIALIYPVFRDNEGIGQEDGLRPPISMKWYGFAKILKQGSALDETKLWGLAIGAVLGLVFTILEQKPRLRTWVPSPTGIGIGMLVPASYVATMFVGALLDFLVRRRTKSNADAWAIPLASGFIAGEALIAVLLAVLIAVGVLEAAH